MEKDTWKVWLFRWLFLTCMGVAGWLAQQVWQGQRETDRKLAALELTIASATASRFTLSDWMASRAVIDATFSVNDRRISRLEDFREHISKQLESNARAMERIEQRLGTK